MKKTVFVSAVLLLAACSPDTRHTDPAADAQIRCQHAAVLPDIRDTIRQTMRGEAQRFAAADNRDYVDADKVTAAADRLQVRMDGIRPDGKGCAAHISVVIPQTVLDTATVVMIAFAYFVTFRVMGKDYDAAVLAAGHCGFGMGATPTAVANMQSITNTFGSSHKAFLIVPLVGAFFIDFVNFFILDRLMAWFG